jgi:leucyl aminopeptidase (aminopeptidase T)
MPYSFNVENNTRIGVELTRAAHRLVRYIRPIEKGHQVLISADSSTDMRVVEATAQAVYSAGGIPTIIFYPASYMPMQTVSEPLIGAASRAEVWFDFSISFQLFSPAYHAALLNGCIYLMLNGMSADMMVRAIGQVDCKLLRQMSTWLYTQSQAAQKVRVATPAGTQLTMRVNIAGDPFWESPPETGGYTQVLSGQSGFLVDRESVDGILVIDGSISLPLDVGILHSPITLNVKGGYIQDIQGDVEARILENFLCHDKHPEALLIDHVCYGFNPGVSRLVGRILEDERLFGCIEFGVGAVTYGSPVHTDGICLNPSIWLDEMQIEENGRYVHPDLIQFCEQMGVPGY